MTEEKEVCKSRTIESAILTIRGQKVILDSDLAGIYGVPTKALNQAVKRNAERFPADFMFQLAAQEVGNMRSQFANADLQHIGNEDDTMNWSQIVTSSNKHRGATYRPFAFTEHGAIMAATVLNSSRAVQMSVFIVRAFVRMRQALMSRNEMEKRLDQIEKILLVHDDAVRDLYEKIRPLLLPPPDPPPKRIGFTVKEKRTKYRVKRR